MTAHEAALPAPVSPTLHPRLSRRAVLAGSGLAAAAGLVGCGTGSSSKNNASANAQVQLPTFRRYEGAKPVKPGLDNGTEPAYYVYPENAPTSVPEKPGSGSDAVLGMANIYVAAPPGPDKNSWWAELNDQLGVNLSMTMIPNADYATKFATTIAGNDLPDMMQMQVVANYPSLLEAKFQPLDEYLSGDHIADYPNLANVPTFTWRSAIYNGHLYGIPIPRGRVGQYDLMRADLFEKFGIDPNPKGFDGLLTMLKGCTDAKARRWSFTLWTQAFNVLQRMNEVPNTWALDSGGTLKHAVETDQYQQAVADMITCWKAGVIHPDAFNTNQPFKQLFQGGNCLLDTDGYLAWAGFVTAMKDDASFAQGMFTFTNRDGSKPSSWYPGTGFYSINAFKKADPDRIKLLLRICNFLAAPFGTAEQKFLAFGKEGVDHTVDGKGNPSLTDKGIADIAVPVGYMGASPHALYQPGRPQDVDLQYAYQSTVLPRAVDNPTTGLFSNTAATKDAGASKTYSDTLADIIQGRKPTSALQDAISAWKKASLDDIRKEYTEQLEARGGPSSAPS